jgi:hypothetical protein
MALDADAIVIARMDSPAVRSDGMDFRLTIVRTIHGTPLPGEVLYVSMPLRPPRGPSLFDPTRNVLDTCGLYMLMRAAGGWEIPTRVSALADASMPFTSCELGPPIAYPEKATPREKAFLEAADAVARGISIDTSRVSDLGMGLASESVGEAMRLMAASDQPVIKAQGIAWLVNQGDVPALGELEKYARDPGNPPGPFGSALANYRNPDITGVHILGRIALSADIRDGSTRQCAARALRSIHTREAVPYLAELLKSPDALVRELAVSGLTEHVKGVRITADGPERIEAIDEAFNPGRQGGAERLAEEDFLHIGTFPNAAEETRLIGAWTSWWESRKADFPAMDLSRGQ